MADPLFLSLWLRGYSPLALPVYFKKAIAHFPHSKLNPKSTLRVFPLSFQESPLHEEFLDEALDPEYAVSQARQFLHEDCAFTLESRWELYQFHEDWELRPAKIQIEVFGPDFDTPRGEHLRIDFGPSELFLPHPASDNLLPVQSNIRSLLHVVQDLEANLSVERPLLWSEDDDNFAERLRAMLENPSRIQ